jgi:DNA-binding PadR family transcriptional regulator
MSIRLSLLAILSLGACYGYQLRLEYERRTGGVRALNVGQVYATLDRLERDGLATKADTDGAGHVYYAITESGRGEVDAWLTKAVAGGPLDDVAGKLALVSSIAGADVGALVAAQRADVAARLTGYSSDIDGDPAHRLVVDALAAAARAELRWLDDSESLLVEAEPYALAAEPPRRGRPARALA